MRAFRPMPLCLMAAGAFLFADFLLRCFSLSVRSRSPVELYVLPLAIGLSAGILGGSRWPRPVLASLAFGATLVLAEAIPYTVDTIAMSHEAPATVGDLVHERLDAKLAVLGLHNGCQGDAADRIGQCLERLPFPYRLLVRRNAVVVGRIISFPLGLLIVGGPATIGALMGRRLGRCGSRSRGT